MKTLLERIADMASCVGGNVEEVLLDAVKEIEALSAKVERMEKQEPFDADHPEFRRAFDAALKTGNWPTERKNFGYRSPMSQMAWQVAFCTVNNLKLYALPGAQPAPSVPNAILVAVADLFAQMAIVSRVGFIDTQNDKDSCAAFCVAEGTWLELVSCVESLAVAITSAPKPEAKP